MSPFTVAPGAPSAKAKAIIEAFFAGPEGPPPADRVAWVDADLADFMRHAGPRARLLLRVCIFILRWLAPLFAGRLPPIDRQPLQARIGILAHTEKGVLSLALLGLKALVCLIYYEHPESARAIGFDGGCLGEKS